VAATPTADVGVPVDVAATGMRVRPSPAPPGRQHRPGAQRHIGPASFRAWMPPRPTFLVTALADTAERGPSMYEMEGPRLAVQRCLADCSAARALPGPPPVPDTRRKCQSPGSSRGSRSRPRKASAFSGECSSTARRPRGTRALSRPVQDSLAIHRPSTGQLPFVPGAPPLSPASPQLGPQDRPQPVRSGFGRNSGPGLQSPAAIS
jgi:hypothetical protein